MDQGYIIHTKTDESGEPIFVGDEWVMCKTLGRVEIRQIPSAKFSARIVSFSGAGAPEITPEMIEAGIAAVRSIEFELWEQRTLEELTVLVSAIYKAM